MKDKNHQNDQSDQKVQNDNNNENNGIPSDLPTDEANRILEADSVSLLKSLEENKQKAEENWNLFLRTRADMDNIRRRAQIDNENTRKYANKEFARELLVVLDSLESGLLLAETAGDAAYKEGMALTLKLFLDILEKFGVKRIDPKGEILDPSKHEAISMQVNNAVPPNTILIVAQPGFTLHEQMLRPARVVVSKVE